MKKDVDDDKLHLEDALHNLYDICEDFGIENRNNLVLNAIRNAEPDYVRKLLTLVDRTDPYFRPPWDVERMIERTRYEVRTKKDYLSRTGKEGMVVLLHDCYKRKDTWWKELGVDRIIEALPRESPGKEIVDALFEVSSDLRDQIYSSFPTVVRSGNELVAYHVLKNIMGHHVNDLYKYSQEHNDLLIGNRELLNRYKKFNLIQHN